MNEYNFTLQSEGDVEAHLDELFEAGCDDATFGTLADGRYYADFDRWAKNYEEAVLSAVADIESVPGLRVHRKQTELTKA